MSATSLPAFFFYPSDWMTDLKVQSLNFEQQGIWFAILCVMHECEERGKLMENNRPMSRKTLAKLISCDLRKLNRTMDELLAKKVAYTDNSGFVYNKRMVKDEAIRKARKEAGSMGGNPNLVKPKCKKGSQGGNRSSDSDSTTETNSERVQNLTNKSVNDKDWLANTSALHQIPTPTLQNFCNDWIQMASLRYMGEDYPANKLLSMMLEDLEKEKEKLIPPPKKERVAAYDWY